MTLMSRKPAKLTRKKFNYVGIKKCKMYEWNNTCPKERQGKTVQYESWK